MKLFDGVMKGFANGVLARFLSGQARSYASPANESLCAANGWNVDENPSNTLRLFITDRKGQRRTLPIDPTPGSLFVLLSAARDVPPEILPWLLRRNAQVLTGAWEIRPSAESRVTFLYAYAVLAEGLTPLVFKAVCESIVQEAAEFDSQLEQAGWLL